MGKRREGRQLAVQFLYQSDLNPSVDLKEALELFWDVIENADGDLRDYSEELINGVLEHREKLDQWISQYAQNWDIKRMAVVDKNILRLALYEMHFREDIPPIAAINEAIELSKILGASDSKKFVNGILDRAKQDLKKPLR